jgi:hypothetical protein
MPKTLVSAIWYHYKPCEPLGAAAVADWIERIRIAVTVSFDRARRLRCAQRNGRRAGSLLTDPTRWYIQLCPKSHNCGRK